MTRLFLAACLLLASHRAWADAFKPYHVVSLSGTASLHRFEDEAWPLEAGQDLPGDITLVLDQGALIHLRIWQRLDLALAGPATLRAFALEREEAGGSGAELVFRLEQGELWVDPRMLLGRPSRLTLDLPDKAFEVQGPQPFLAAVEPAGATSWAFPSEGGGLRPMRRVQEGWEPEAGAPEGFPWSGALLELALRPLPVLVLARDYDAERGRWGRPARLGPALAQALGGLPGLELVEGSGDTTLAAYANNAIRSGQDFFLRQLARERGARLLVSGNNVVEQVREEGYARNPHMSAVAELQVLESQAGGEVLVADSATTLVARAGRSLEDAGSQALAGSAQRAALYLRGHMEALLRGEPHQPRLLKLVFNNVSEARQRELRRALSALDSVQRFFKRGFASGVLRLDVILRGGEEKFLGQLEAWPFETFLLEKEEAEGLAFTLRPRAPTPPPIPTPEKRPKDWRR